MKSFLKFFKTDSKDKSKSKKEADQGLAVPPSVSPPSDQSPSKVPRMSPSPEPPPMGSNFGLGGSDCALLRSCAVCATNKANPYRDLCQDCYLTWAATDKKKCARCKTRKVDGNHDLCTTCYTEWKARTQEEEFASIPPEDLEEIRELCQEVVCSDKDVVAEKLDEGDLWAEIQVDPSIAEENCPICLCEYSEDVCVKLNCCPHIFHKDCIRGCLGQETYLKCPLCSVIIGTYVGTQPPGKMTVTVQMGRTLEGSPPGTGLIYVTYTMPGGKQGKSHPAPGKPYSGTFREAYFPNTPEGRRIVRLMKVAFKRKLVFTIGTSVTSGKSDTVTWNGIHHKTHPCGGAERHGYPDPTYLLRVEQELASFGVLDKTAVDKGKDNDDGNSGNCGDGSNDGCENDPACVVSGTVENVDEGADDGVKKSKKKKSKKSKKKTEGEDNDESDEHSHKHSSKHKKDKTVED